MWLIERLTGNDYEWFDGDNLMQFLYLAWEEELYSNENPDDMPIATPSTPAEARAIIEQNGHTIS